MLILIHMPVLKPIHTPAPSSHSGNLALTHSHTHALTYAHTHTLTPIGPRYPGGALLAWRLVARTLRDRPGPPLVEAPVVPAPLRRPVDCDPPGTLYCWAHAWAQQ